MCDEAIKQIILNTLTLAENGDNAPIKFWFGNNTGPALPCFAFGIKKVSFDDIIDSEKSEEVER